MANTPSQRARKFDSPGHYTKGDREKMEPGEFGDPANKKFPIVTAQDVMDAAHLIGKASDPERVKARIIAIANKHGWPIPDAWKTDEDKRMTQSDPTLDAEVVRDGPPEVTRFALPSTIRVVDQADRIVEVCATSEAVDSYQTVFGYDASKDAFQRWAGNVREMHDRRAVGRKVEVRCDDAERKIYVRARISKGAEDTWQKLLDGTLTGASIGASKVQWQHERRGTDVIPVAKRYDLVELSLVDVPSNPDSATAGVTFIRSAAMVDDLFDEMPAPIDAEPLDDDLRPVSVDGAGTVKTQIDQPADLDELGGPPANPDDATFAASRPEGTLPVPLLGEASERVTAAPAPAPAATTGTTSLTDRVQALLAEATPPLGAPVAAVQPPAPPLVQATPLAPFGAGAPLPPNQGHLPTARQVAQAQRAERNAAELAVRAAGDQAEALFPPWDRLEDYPAYVRRRALVRGAAEKQVIDQQYVQRRARELAAARDVVTRPAPGRAPVVRSVTPQVAAAPDSAPTPLGPAEMERARAAAPAETATVRAAAASEKPNAAIVATGPIPPAPQMSGSNGVVTGGAAAGNTRHAHVHSHAHATSAEAHVHDTAHTHEDGTTHAHPHRHDHAHHDHGDEHVTMPGVANRADAMTTATEGGHTHQHTHPHDHTHVYRAGQPTDARLVLADATRDAEATRAAERARSSMTLEASGPSPVKPLASITPASGSAMYQSDEVSKPKSPQMSVHPQEVGHLDLLNTEDANATTFGVPPEVQIEATPADGQIAEPVGFHEGGHQAGSLTTHTGLSPANKEVGPRLAAQKSPDGPLTQHDTPDPAGQMDQDLDHDGAEDAMEQAAALAGNGKTTTLPGLDQGARPSTKNAALLHEDEKTAARAAGGGAKMDDDLDDDGDEDEAEEEGGSDEGASQENTPTRPPAPASGAKKSRRSVAAEVATEEADETRVGARISAESRAALHAVRDGQTAQLRSLCQHCGCDECSAYTDALDEMVQGAGHYETPPSPEEVARLAEVFGRQRLLAHLVQTGVRAETERLAGLVEGLLARTRDLELTLAAQAQAHAEAQAQQSAHQPTFERMQAAEEARFASFRADLDTDLATALVAAMNQVMSPIAQRMEAVASLGEAVDALKADVERIAAQPVSGGGPMVGLADKRLPFDPDALRQTVADASGLGSASVSPVPSGNPNDPLTQIAALQALARTTTDPNQQMLLARRVAELEAQANGGQPPTRRLVGGSTPAAAAMNQVLGQRALVRTRQNGR